MLFPENIALPDNSWTKLTPDTLPPVNTKLIARFWNNVFGTTTIVAMIGDDGTITSGLPGPSLGVGCHIYLYSKPELATLKLVGTVTEITDRHPLFPTVKSRTYDWQLYCWKLRTYSDYEWAKA